MKRWIGTEGSDGFVAVVTIKLKFDGLIAANSTVGGM
jgi:hypothetical protein